MSLSAVSHIPRIPGVQGRQANRPPCSPGYPGEQGGLTDVLSREQSPYKRLLFFSDRLQGLFLLYEFLTILSFVIHGKRFAAMKLMSDKIRETDVKAHLAFFDGI